jgi:sporulation protein YlmC with PRC-barrel domain
VKQLRRFRELADLALHATDGDLGSVEDLYLDDRHWQVRYLVVKTGGWLLGRYVLIAPVSVREIDDAEGTLHVNLTREQIEQSPPIDRAKPVSRAYEQAYYRHFRLAPYWDTVPGPWGTAVPYPGTVPPTIEKAGAAAQPEHPHLRSAKELTGYAIRARDGEIGHLEDVVVDDEDWVVRYVEVDTRKWLPGKKVLMQAGRIEEISWAARHVKVGLTRLAIESAPAYDPSEVITPEYEVQLFKHYSKDAA